MRKIIHVDADSFYASVEIRDSPSLADKAVAVGGSPGGRGVIATCNYHARRFGVHSAMPSSHALRLCPQLVFVKPKFDLYRSVSLQILQIFSQYTDKVEPLSLDEAYLDVTDVHHCQGSATLIAEEIRRTVKDRVEVTVSAGVAPNKFLAKVASDWNKPDGIFVIKPEEISTFVKDLPVRKINGVGKVTAAKMEGLGIVTCGDLQGLEISELSQHFGSWGARLYDLARGTDEREVQTERTRKSLSTEHTYDKDLTDLSAVIGKCKPIFDELTSRFFKISEEYRVTKRFVKIKFTDFSQTTLEESLPESENWADIDDFTILMTKAWQRRNQPVRLLGMGVRLGQLQDTRAAEQLSLF